METRTQLKEIREQRGVSAARLAKLAGTSRQTVYAIEAGDYVPNTALALQLAKTPRGQGRRFIPLGRRDSRALRSCIGGFDRPAAPRTKGSRCGSAGLASTMVGVSAIPQPAMLPMADGVIVDSSKRTTQAAVHVFQEHLDNGSGC